MGKSPKDTHGPVVKSGPTAGQNRSRRDDGGWRRKRSDAGKTRSNDKGGCFLTTAACRYRGLPDDCYELGVLRQFRDEFLLTSPERAPLVDEYYAEAPRIAADLTPNDLRVVWETVCTCIADIEAGHREKALSRYQDLFLRLKGKG